MTERQEEKHAALESLEFSDGVLVWAGQKVTDIATKIGQTPFYVYDQARMKSRVNELRKALPPKLRIHYAMKANPLPEVVQYIAKLVDGLDIASSGELLVALETDTDPADISFAGPGKRNEELRHAILADITINMESAGEMTRISQIANDIGKRPNVAIRVNPSFELKTAGMKMGGRPSQFGVDAEQVPDMLVDLSVLDFNFRGFHVFSGSQNLRPDAIAESISKTAELVIDLANSTDLNVSMVNIGGGLGIPYFPNERPFDLGEISATAEQAISRLEQALGEVEIITELGRFLVGEAGIYVVRVIDIKESRGARFAVCDGGLHHHLAASGNFGQVIRKNYPVVAVNLSDDTEEVTVVGPLCTPLDLLGDRVSISEISEGSLVAILQSGAYGRTASPARFLSHPECTEVMY